MDEGIIAHIAGVSNQAEGEFHAGIGQPEVGLPLFQPDQFIEGDAVQFCEREKIGRAGFACTGFPFGDRLSGDAKLFREVFLTHVPRGPVEFQPFGKGCGGI